MNKLVSRLDNIVKYSTITSIKKLLMIDQIGKCDGNIVWMLDRREGSRSSSTAYFKSSSMGEFVPIDPSLLILLAKKMVKPELSSLYSMYFKEEKLKLNRAYRDEVVEILEEGRLQLSFLMDGYTPLGLEDVIHYINLNHGLASTFAFGNVTGECAKALMLTPGFRRFVSPKSKVLFDFSIEASRTDQDVIDELIAAEKRRNHYKENSFIARIRLILNKIVKYEIGIPEVDLDQRISEELKRIKVLRAGDLDYIRKFLLSNTIPGKRKQMEELFESSFSEEVRHDWHLLLNNDQIDQFGLAKILPPREMRDKFNEINQCQRESYAGTRICYTFDRMITQ